MGYDSAMPPPRPADPSFGVELGVLPSDRSYWIVPGRFAAGAYPSHETPRSAEERLRRIAALRFGYVVDLTAAGEINHTGQTLHAYAADLCRYAAEFGCDLQCVRQPIPDMSIPSVESMQAILDGIDAAITSGRRSYVHCWGGFGRTGTVVGCYLVRHGMAAGEEALAMIRYLRRTEAKALADSPQTDEQRQFVLAWRRGL